MIQFKTHVLGSAMMMMCVLSMAHAETARRDDGGQQASAKAQYMLRQLSDEKAALEAANAQLKADLEKAEKKLERNSKKEGSLSERLEKTKALLEKYQQNNDALRDRIEKDRERTMEVVDKFKETIALLKQIEAEKTQYKNDAASYNKRLNECVDKNIDLYKTGVELLDQYTQKSVWESVSEKEPVLQMQRVKLENLIQDYKDKIHDLKVEQFAGEAPH